MLKIADVSHVTYRIPDLSVQETFLTDFGLVGVARSPGRLVMRGAGSAPYCYVAEQGPTPGLASVAYRVDRAADLEAATRIAGASGIEDIGLPGGGHKVTLHDPDGVRVELVHGIAPAEPLPLRRPLPINHADVKHRYGDTQRLAKGPAQVLRLGHVLFFVADIARSMAWYREHFGMIPSDTIHEGEPANTLGAFMRCDRGAAFTDHHTVGLFQAPPGVSPKLHHASFEVQDFDAQWIGTEWLTAKGYRHEWGIGRHLLGSQIFDYWRDPWGLIVEHFTDGDLLKADMATGNHPAGVDSLYQWGPPVPESFFA